MIEINWTLAAIVSVVFAIFVTIMGWVYEEYKQEMEEMKRIANEHEQSA